MKALLGHDGPPQGLWRENLITDKPLEECPLRTLLRAREAKPTQMHELDRYRDTYAPAYADGHLLVAGGITDQPARYLDLILAMRAMDTAMQTKFDAITAETAGEPE